MVLGNIIQIANYNEEKTIFLKTFMLKYNSSYLQARHSDSHNFCLVSHFILSDILSKIGCYPLN